MRNKKKFSGEVEKMKKVLTIICLITAIAALQACRESGSGSDDLLSAYLLAGSESATDNGEEHQAYSAFVEGAQWEELATPVIAGEYEISNPYLEFMPDGRMVIVEGNDDTSIEVAVESNDSIEGSRDFSYVMTIKGTGNWYYTSFVKVAGGDEIIVGTGDRIYLANIESGEYEVLAETANFDAVLSGSTLYFTWAGIDYDTWEYNGHVSSLNIDDDPMVITDLISGIPGASAGIAVDDNGNLYTGNGYANMGYATGEIRSFDMDKFPLVWDEGVFAGDVLTSGSLIWAGKGILLVGGGEAFVADGDNDYFAALDTSDGGTIWMIDPDEGDSSTYRLSGDPDESLFAAGVWDYSSEQGVIYLAY